MSEFTFDGAAIPFAAGQSVAAALLNAGVYSWRSTRDAGRPRGLFCGIGVCFDCLITVDGAPNIRACLYEAADGMHVTPQRGTGHPPTAPANPPVDSAVDVTADAPAGGAAVGAVRAAVAVKVVVDVAVVGAGPAGLAAASAAAAGGVPVALIDAAPRAGGQFWRHRTEGVTQDADLHHDLPAFAALRPRDGVRHLPGHQVWTLRADADGCTVWALAPDGTETVVHAGYLVLAPGAYDRQIPFAGWDLPGVMTAGGAQALLKGQGVLPGRRVLVAGTGPFLLPVAAGLAARGATVVGVHEANHPGAWLRYPVRALAKLPEAAEYMRILRRHRVPVRYRSAVVGVEGDERVTTALIARVGRDGAFRTDRLTRVAVDVVAVGWGFTPQLELPLAAGCEARLDEDGSLVIVTDDNQFTSNPRVLVAGEATGIGGASLALTEGTRAGIAATQAVHHDPNAPHTGRGGVSGSVGSGEVGAGASARAGRGDAGGALTRRQVGRSRRRRGRLRAFARALHRVYPVPARWVDGLPDETVVCRCEEVTVGRLREAVELGATDVRTAKLLARAGMGWCQGRVCGYASACLVAHWTGAPYDPRGIAERPVAAPIPLGTLARGGD